MGYWGFLGVIVGTGGYSGVLQVLGVLRGTWGNSAGIAGVLWGTVGNYGVLQVLGILGGTGGQKKSTVGYYMVWQAAGYKDTAVCR